jgi:hypothetical protein
VNLPGWVEHHLKRTGEDRAQIVRDKLKKGRHVEASKSPLIVPTHLSWEEKEKLRSQENRRSESRSSGRRSRSNTGFSTEERSAKGRSVDIPGEFRNRGVNGRLTTREV